MIEELKDTLSELDIIKTPIVGIGGGTTGIAMSYWNITTGIIITICVMVFVFYRAVSAGLKAKKDKLELQMTIDMIEERKNKRDSNETN